MTDTDLITAGGSSENVELPNTVTSDDSSPAAADAPIAAPPAETTPTADDASGNRSASLSTMVLPELRALAKEIGVEGASGMRKSELIAAIRERRGQSNGRERDEAKDSGARSDSAPADTATATATATDDGTSAEAGDQPQQRRERRGASRVAGEARAGGSAQNKQDAGQSTKTAPAGYQAGDQRSGDQQQGDQQGTQQGRSDDDGEGRQGRRGRRFRDRRRRGERGGGDTGNGEAELREDDVVQPVAGILDVLDNYAFVRTSGYLAGPNDVYVSMNMVRKNGLRRGDAVTGAVRVPKDGEQPNQRQKFNPLVRLDTVNGGPVEDAKKRPDFTKLTPLYPNQRLRLETTPDRLTTRVIDLIMPIGKGQRALIVSPPKAGKTTILQDIANGDHHRTTRNAT